MQQPPTPNTDNINLLKATYRGDLEQVKALIKKEVDVNFIDKYDFNAYPALKIAARMGNLDVVMTLLEAGADVNQFKPSNNRNILMSAAQGCHFDIAKTLIDNGADVKAVDIYGNTALHLTIDPDSDFKTHPDYDYSETMPKDSYIKTAETLINAGANIGAANKDGNTPLHFTAEKGNPGVAKLLLEKGALLDSVNNDGKTPLQVIAEKEIPNAEHLITAKILLEKGADLEKIGKQSKLYPLLKIIGNLNDDEIKVVANNLEDFKTIYDTTLPFRNFKNSKPQSGEDTIGILGNDLMSMSLEHLLSKELKERLGKNLTSKLVKNLLETLSPETSPSAQSSQIAGSQQVSSRSPSTEFRVTTVTKVTKQGQERN